MNDKGKKKECDVKKGIKTKASKESKGQED